MMDLSRFDAALLIAFTARKQMNYGLLRQFTPKGTSLADISRIWLNDVATLMNSRPRKTLG
jgi:IS30 family transposase